MQIRERIVLIDSSGDNAVVVQAAIPGCIIRVIQLAFAIVAADTMQFSSFDGATDTFVTGAMSFGDNGQFFDRCARPNGGLFSTRPGESLRYTMSNGNAVQGYAAIQIIPVTT